MLDVLDRKRLTLAFHGDEASQQIYRSPAFEHEQALIGGIRMLHRVRQCGVNSAAHAPVEILAGPACYLFLIRTVVQ